MRLFKSSVVFFICLLTACASHRERPVSAALNTPTDTLTGEPTELQSKTETEQKTTLSATQISSWNLSGAMAVKNNQKKGWSASLDWTQQGLNHYQIRLLGPLGGGTIIIAKQGGVVTYTDGPKKITSPNADELLMKQTGIKLPVNNLYYWVRGIPAPGPVQSSHMDKNHNLSILTQGGYTIHYENYTVVKGVSLPGKIKLEGHQVRIRLAIKRWNI